MQISKSSLIIDNKIAYVNYTFLVGDEGGKGTIVKSAKFPPDQIQFHFLNKYLSSTQTKNNET
jgi:hypothetical protein